MSRKSHNHRTKPTNDIMRNQGQQPTSAIWPYAHTCDCNICSDSWQNRGVHNAAEHYSVHQTCPFQYCTYFTGSIISIHILFIIDTTTKCTQIISVTEYLRKWSKCLNIHCASETRYFDKQTVHSAEHCVH